jgi:hypothetical protein
VTVVLVISIVLGVVAFFQRQEAVRQAKNSRASELAAQSILNRDGDFQISLLLGIEAFHSFNPNQSRAVLLDNVNTNCANS